MRQIFKFNKTVLSLGRSVRACGLLACLLVLLSTWILPDSCSFAQTNFQNGAAKIPVEADTFKIEFPEFDDDEWDGTNLTNHTADPALPPKPDPIFTIPPAKNEQDSTVTKLSSFGTAFSDVESWIGKFKRLTASSDVGRMLGSLALVLGLYFGFVWIMRKLSPSGNQNLPREVLELMGQIPFGPKRHLQLIRLGSKLLLIINSAEGSQAIGEITDPNEVEYLVALCSGRRHPFQPKMRPAPAATAPSPPSPPSPPAQPQAQQQNNLANILRTLDLSGHSNNSVFEA
ncbi:MAG: FliO/MopB family protein [Mariniblastus sp.]